MTETFYYPPTLANWPWPRAFNPHYEEMKTASDEWLRSFNALRPRSQRAFEKCDFSRIAALTYPKLGKEHFRVMCDFMNVVFIIDEYTDVEDAAAAQRMVDACLDALKNPHQPRPEGEVVLGEITRQFWERAVTCASPCSQRHFIRNLADWFVSVVTQAEDRDSRVCRDIEGYLAIRRDNIALRAASLGVEIAFDIPDVIYYDPLIYELAGHIAELVIIDNDIASYNREQATGDENHNLITAITRERNVSVNEAVAWAVVYHATVQRKFLHGLKHVPSWGPELDPLVDEYLQGLGNWARGNDCWNFESQRYFGTRGSHFQSTRLIPILPKVVVDPTLHEENIIVAEIEL